MKKILLCAIIILTCTVPAMADGLDNFLDNLNVQAGADREGYATQLGIHFSAPRSSVDHVLASVISLGDAFMIFQLGRMTGLSLDRIMGTYRGQKNKGWGAMAQDLGIKPGSAEFHALKRGDFNFVMPRSGKGGSMSGGGAEGKKSGHDKEKKK